MSTAKDAHHCHNEPAKQLNILGWNTYCSQKIVPEEIKLEHVLRVLSAQRDQFLVSNGQTEWFCKPAGKLRYTQQQEYPVTGDWVYAPSDIITQVLPRKNLLCRAESGSHTGRKQFATKQQAIGANIDTAFIVCGLDRDYNLRRIERYLTLVYNCGIAPVIVLSKADLHTDLKQFQLEVESIAFGVPIILTSMLDKSGLMTLQTFFDKGQTVAMLGSSGAGKSTLANMLYGEEIRATAAVSSSLGKGRHTTTTRELIPMPQGGLLLDNPGIREIAFFTDAGGLATSFPDIQEFAKSCRFANCTHVHEPNCAVLQAVRDKKLEPSRLQNFYKMSREMAYATERHEKSAERIEKERWRDIALQCRRIKKKG